MNLEILKKQIEDFEKREKNNLLQNQKKNDQINKLLKINKEQENKLIMLQKQLKELLIIDSNKINNFNFEKIDKNEKIRVKRMQTESSTMKKTNSLSKGLVSNRRVLSKTKNCSIPPKHLHLT